MNVLLVAWCICRCSSLSIASNIGPPSSQRRAHHGHGRTFHRQGRGAPKNLPKDGTLLAEKDDWSFPFLPSDPSLAFVGGLRDGILKAIGLEDSAVEDEAWGLQIVNATNILAENITADAVSETWRKVLRGEDDGDALDHVWRDVLGDWSRVRRSRVLLAGVRAVCVAVLTWGFCESVLSSVTISGIRIWTAMRQKSFVMRWDSFLRITPEHRTVVLNAYGILKFRFEALFFALKALGTLVVVPYYESLICTIESVCFSNEYRKKYPLVSRLQGLIMSVLVGWMFARALAGAGVLACTILGLGKLWIAAKLNSL